MSPKVSFGVLQIFCELFLSSPLSAFRDLSWICWKVYSRHFIWLPEISSWRFQKSPRYISKGLTFTFSEVPSGSFCRSRLDVSKGLLWTFSDVFSGRYQMSPLAFPEHCTFTPKNGSSWRSRMTWTFQKVFWRRFQRSPLEFSSNFVRTFSEVSLVRFQTLSLDAFHEVHVMSWTLLDFRRDLLPKKHTLCIRIPLGVSLCLLRTVSRGIRVTISEFLLDVSENVVWTFSEITSECSWRCLQRSSLDISERFLWTFYLRSQRSPLDTFKSVTWTFSENFSGRFQRSLLSSSNGSYV